MASETEIIQENQNKKEQLHKEFEEDSKLLKNQFDSFSAKYGKHIAGFELQRLYDCAWSMRIIVDGRLFH